MRSQEQWGVSAMWLVPTNLSHHTESLTECQCASSQISSLVWFLVFYILRLRDINNKNKELKWFWLLYFPSQSSTSLFQAVTVLICLSSIVIYFQYLNFHSSIEQKIMEIFPTNNFPLYWRLLQMSNYRLQMQQRSMHMHNN